MIYRLDLDGETRVLISHMPPGTKRKIRESLRSIAGDPAQGKALQDELSGYFSYRVGAFRIVYGVDRAQRIVHVVAIGPRRNVYDELERALVAKKRA